MKLLLLLGISLLSLSPRNNHQSSLKPATQKYYFFCYSRSMQPVSVDGQQYVLYTDFYEITTDSITLNKLAHAWGDFVNERCMNKLGCTSDLNTYKDEKMARQVYDQLVQKYSNKEKFVTTRISFPYEETLKK